MNELFEEIELEITDNNEISIRISGLESINSTAPESGRKDRKDKNKERIKYTETSLSEEMVATMDGWQEEKLHAVSDDVVKAYLPEILLLLISIRGEACGSELTADVDRLFGTTVSTGTLYPSLNKLSEEGVLEPEEFQKHKVYYLGDQEAISDTVDSTVNQLLFFSVVLKLLATECLARQSDSRTEKIHERE